MRSLTWAELIHSIFAAQHLRSQFSRPGKGGWKNGLSTALKSQSTHPSKSMRGMAVEILLHEHLCGQ